MLVAVGIFVAAVPAPGSDHHQNKPPTFREQNLIDIGIVRADLLRGVRNIELDGSTTARFEVDEEQAVTGVEEVARMRFAVQQLVHGAAAANPLPSALQRIEEEAPVGFRERRGFVRMRDQSFRCGDSIQEVWGGDLDGPHAGVEAMEHLCISPG